MDDRDEPGYATVRSEGFTLLKLQQKVTSLQQKLRDQVRASEAKNIAEVRAANAENKKILRENGEKYEKLHKEQEKKYKDIVIQQRVQQQEAHAAEMQKLNTELKDTRGKLERIKLAFEHNIRRFEEGLKQKVEACREENHKELNDFFQTHTAVLKANETKLKTANKSLEDAKREHERIVIQQQEAHAAELQKLNTELKDTCEKLERAGKDNQDKDLKISDLEATVVALRAPAAGGGGGGGGGGTTSAVEQLSTAHGGASEAGVCCLLA